MSSSPRLACRASHQVDARRATKSTTCEDELVKSLARGVRAMRVLFTAPAGLGHLHPLMPLAAAMSERGHEGRFASDPASCAPAERAGLAVTPGGPSGERRRELIETTFGVNPSSAPRREHS